MRRRVIQTVLPLVFAVLPLLGALLVVGTLPVAARAFYVNRLTGPDAAGHALDWVIVGMGVSLFGVQSYLAWRALRWRGTSFDERPDAWLTRLAQASEWFPLLGLIGTVAGILQTFSSITGPTPPEVIIQKYAPAITATGSGLFMALLNILPAWVVLIGRGVILTLGGEEPDTGGH